MKDRPGHDRRYAIDCTKAERELGWSPQVTFEHGLRRDDRLVQGERRLGRGDQEQGLPELLREAVRGARVGPACRAVGRSLRNRHVHSRRDSGGRQGNPHGRTDQGDEQAPAAGRRRGRWSTTRSRSSPAPGCSDILLVSGTEHMGDFVELLGSGTRPRLPAHVPRAGRGRRHRPGARAWPNTSAWAAGRCVLLGDNIFRDPLVPLLEKANTRPDWAWIGLKQVPDPGRYGVAELQGRAGRRHRGEAGEPEERPRGGRASTSIRRTCSASSRR